MWDLIVSVPDHCISFYFTGATDMRVNVCFKQLTSVSKYVISEIFSESILYFIVTYVVSI